MKTNILRKLIIAGICIATFAVTAATISRIKTFSDGEILTASDLNSEFDNVVDGVNSITNDNVASNAALSPAKFSAAIKGDAIARDPSTGSLSVKVDNSTIEIILDSLRVKDGGITGAKLNANTVDNVTLEKTGTTLNIKNDGVTTTKIANGAITTTKIANGAITAEKKAALGQQISASSGLFSVSDSNTFYADVPNLSVTITTSGRPVFIGLIPDGTDQNALSCTFQTTTFPAVYRIDRSGTGVAFISTSTTAQIIPCTALQTIDVPAAGTYTYKIQHRAASGGGSSFRSLSYAKLIAYEL
jgi:hypothetical protein